jgi:hypothetical protein
MLDAVAADAEYAVESVRAKKRSLGREKQDSFDESFNGTKYRDPGYSQAVRRTCQQRMVQLIPIRRGTLTVVLVGMWMIWVGLVFAHYWLHVPAASIATATGSAVLNATATAPASAASSKLPIFELFNLRSSNSIAHWLTCQLWMMTALAAWMNFQLRRHKLDDYRARYRIWAVLACAALFSSFDASSSFLYLLGMSVDGWTRSEIGYGGWPLVLATFASLIGILGIRLCNELRTVPGSVASWMTGLLAWAASALLGTGLLKTSWAPATVDLIVGSCWLSGILLVFQAAGIYLRQTYIAAQKRFLERNGMNLQPIRFQAPQFKLPFQRKKNDQDENEESTTDRKSRKEDLAELPAKKGWKMPWGRRSNDISQDDEDVAPSENRSTSTKAKSKSEPAENQETRSAKPKSRLFGLIPNRSEQNERLEEQPIRIDDGPEVDNGLTKKPGWFGIGGNRSKAERNSVEPNGAERIVPSTDSQSRRASTSSVAAVTKADDDSQGDSDLAKKSLWSRLRRQKQSAPKAKSDSVEAGQKSKRGWLPQIGRSRTIREQDASETTQSSKQAEPSVAKKAKDPSQKSSWLSFVSRKAKSTDSEQPADPRVTKKQSESDQDKPIKRRLFGLLDGLRLKPPGEEDRQDPKTATKSMSSGPVTVKPSQTLPSTQSNVEEDDDYDDDTSNGRPLSKAERKRLKRMQQDDRRAA